MKISKDGQTAYSSFVEEHLNDDDKMFHDPIKKKTLYLFKDTAQKVIVEKNGKTKIIEVNRNFFSFLLALCAKSSKNIDYPKALQYILCVFPVSLSNADGSKMIISEKKIE